MPNKTPLYEAHVALGAQMVDFGGWLMPVRYTSDKEEHFATRKSVGLFDVSHMGEVFLRGPKAVEATDYLLSNNIQRLKIGQAAYSMMLNEQGGIVDDVIAYKLADDEMLICINAGNRDKDVAWIQKTVGAKYPTSEVEVSNESDDWAQIAIQGPAAKELFDRVLDPDTWPGEKFWFSQSSGKIIARTGYTGEDGVEIFLPSTGAQALWDKLLDAGSDLGCKPCGLSARDSLRLEAGLCLYGNDINENTSPLEANLMWTVKLKSGNFVGRDAIVSQKETGSPAKKLVGLKITGRGIARHDYPIQNESGSQIGIVTSGTQSPTLAYPIAMAYIDAPHFETENLVYVNVRNRPVAAEVMDLPFLPRG